MRTKRIKIYRFEELSKEAQNRVIAESIKLSLVTGLKDYHADYARKVIIENEYEFLQDGTIYNQ